jgi:hypothetical protein
MDDVGCTDANPGAHARARLAQVAAESGNGSSLLSSLFQITPTLPIPAEMVDPGGSLQVTEGRVEVGGIIS